MQPSIKIDTSKFSKVLREYMMVSKRGLAEDINNLAYSIVNAAYGLTKQADKAQIKEIFAPTGKKEVGRKVRIVNKKYKVK